MSRKSLNTYPRDAKGKVIGPEQVVWDSDGNKRILPAPHLRKRTPCWHSRWSKWRTNSQTGQQRRNCIQCSLYEIRDSEDSPVQRKY